MTSHRDKATNQMEENRKTIRNPGMITTGNSFLLFYEMPFGTTPVLYTVGPGIGHILEQEFFCLDRLGSQGSKGKKVDLRNSKQLLRVFFSTFGGQNKHFKNFLNVCLDHQNFKKPPSKVA